MSSYTGSAAPPDRAKAVVAVAIIHVVLAALIVAGLNVDRFRSAVEQLKTFDIREVPPPVLPPPEPRVEVRHRTSAASAPAAPRAVPAPVRQAPAARIGNPSGGGMGGAGDGSGVGGAGNGGGLGGDGADYSRFTPARLLSNIPSSQYRELASTGLPSGLVGVTIRVNPDGSVGDCRVARSSGDPGLDGLVCRLTTRFVRFDPARDAQGRAVAQDITYFPNWRRRAL